MIAKLSLVCVLIMGISMISAVGKSKKIKFNRYGIALIFLIVSIFFLFVDELLKLI